MGNHSGRPEDPEAGLCGVPGVAAPPRAWEPFPHRPGPGRAARGRRGGEKAKFPGVSPASGMRGGGGRLTCARAATGERRRLTWRPDGRRGAEGRGPGSAFGEFSLACLHRGKFYEGFRAPATGAGREQTVSTSCFQCAGACLGERDWA